MIGLYLISDNIMKITPIETNQLAAMLTPYALELALKYMDQGRWRFTLDEYTFVLNKGMQTLHDIENGTRQPFNVWRYKQYLLFN